MSKPTAEAAVKRAVAHVKKCLNDLAFYAAEHLIIVPKNRSAEKMRFNRAQQIVTKKVSEQRKKFGYVMVIILKARQEGISTWTAARFFRAFSLIPNRKCLVISHKKEPAEVIFKTYERFYENLDESVKLPKVSSQRGNYLELVNGSIIAVETAGDTDAGRGSTIHHLHVSELAFWNRASDVWTSLNQAIPDRGAEIVIESTANGVGNFFHQMWKDAEAGNSDFLAIFLPWFIHEEYTWPVTDEERREIQLSDDPFERTAQDEGYDFEGEKVLLTPEQLQWRRRTIQNKLAGNERKFRQEYPTTSREAFIVTGDGFFDNEALERYETTTVPYKRRGTMVATTRGTIKFQDGERGPVRMWTKPRKDGIYVIGADTSSGSLIGAKRSEDDERGGRDFSGAFVLDVKLRRIVAQVHARIHPEEFAKQLNYIGYLYGTEGPGGTRFPATIAVERNHASGETVLKKLQLEHKYPAMYYGRRINTRTNRITSELGWRTTKANRGPLLDELAEAVRNESIAIPDLQTIGEMYTFVRNEEGRPEAQEGAHDDRVISLGITLQVAQTLDHEPKKTFTPPPEVPDTPTGYLDLGY